MLSMKTENPVVDVIIAMVKNTPNDKELGEKVRKYINELLKKKCQS